MEHEIGGAQDVGKNFSEKNSCACLNYLKVWALFSNFSVSIPNGNYNKETQMDPEKKEKTEFIFP